jgi:hypothetical protein
MKRPLIESIGYRPDVPTPQERQTFLEYVNLKLAIRGGPIFGRKEDYHFLPLCDALLANFQEKNRLLSGYLCPADQRVHDFLTRYLGESLEGFTGPLVPSQCLILDRHGLARVFSLPPDQDRYENELITSTRVHQGVCHNPRADRRTTEGVFHVVEGGFAVPGDKRAVPKLTFARLLKAALHPPASFLRVPFSQTLERPSELFFSLLVRPLVHPEVPGVRPALSLETRFFAPGGLVSNLDFVESIFGNAGDPTVAEHDAALDPATWTGHTGCVILAPHLTRLTKKELGLPNIAEATPRQRADGMCWSDPAEKYNQGGAFKVVCRDASGVFVTLIADNYFGYCKKDVKTQISYAANLFGFCEEEHAGGALVFPSYDLGEDFQVSENGRGGTGHTFEEAIASLDGRAHLTPEGYAVDREWPDIFYIPENARMNLTRQRVVWNDRAGRERQLRLVPGHTYVYPSGYKVTMMRPNRAQRWRLVGTTAEGLFCHKPCTVSGGGKSEISKPITDAILTGPIITTDFRRDMDAALAIIHRDFSDRFKQPREPGKPSRPLLSPKRSLGSVVRMLNPNPDYTDAYNAWLATIPRTIRDLVLTIKRYYQPDWEENWPERFSVDIVNGRPDFMLKYRKQRMETNYLRVGFNADGAWRTFSLRKDYAPAAKLQTEDDISASVVMPNRGLPPLPSDFAQAEAVKITQNCEFRLFQRPDEAIVRGYDKKAEEDFTHHDGFFSNYEPLTRDQAREIVEDTLGFDEFTPPVQELFKDFVAAEAPAFMVSTSHPRLVNGKPSSNPRYLQNRPDLENPRAYALAEIGARLARRLRPDQSVLFPVGAVLSGRRNNPPDAAAGIRNLAVYNPIHYQELPELFMDYIASLTGKSPSTTGAGSEGALTKGPFNGLPAIIDLNNTLVSMALTGLPGFSTAAGHIGPRYRMDHDISLLVPEIWSRLQPQEREAGWLIEHGYLEPVADYEHHGQSIPASRLGYRITDRFVSNILGRVFSNPSSVFTEDMLRPELQDADAFADGVLNIAEAHRKVALHYFEDGTVDLACPPLRALLHIMAHGHWEGKPARDPEVRALFAREAILGSDWYAARLHAAQAIQVRRWTERVAYLERWLARPEYSAVAEELGVHARLVEALRRRNEAESPAFLESLAGTLGTDPAVLPPPA